MLISAKVYFRKRTSSRDKEEYFIPIKMSIYHKILNVYVPNNSASDT